MSFVVPDYYEMRATRSWRDEKGNNWRSLGNTCWFTNLEHDHRNKPLVLTKRYDPRYYPKYDNYDAIEVSKVMDIPVDYEVEKIVTEEELNKLKEQGFIIEIIEEY